MTQVIPILLYHSVDHNRSRDYARWVVTPACFESHLELIREGGFKPTTVEAFASSRASGETLPKGTVIITFDDGLADFMVNAMPILARFGFPATLFVTSGFVGGRAGWLADLGEGSRSMMTWKDIVSVAGAGIEIGAHSISHPQLDLIGREHALREINGSRRAIEDAIGRPVSTFAYPHGYSDRRTRRMVSEAGFKAACGVRHALSSDCEHPHRLSRIIMEESMSPEIFRNVLAGRGLPVAPAPCQPAVFGWRQVRRIKRTIHHARSDAFEGGSTCQF